MSWHGYCNIVNSNKTTKVMAKETRNTEKHFFIRISGVDNFDEQCRIQCEIQNTLKNLGYNVTSRNFSINFYEYE